MLSTKNHVNPITVNFLFSVYKLCELYVVFSKYILIQIEFIWFNIKSQSYFFLPILSF